MGKGKQSETQAAKEHISKPLASLKDPASFGPPPKNVNYHGGAALPNEITPHRGGLGAPLTQAEISSANRMVQAVEVEEEEDESQSKSMPPPLPFRADRTGLKTDNLPPPPVHRDLQQFQNHTARSPSPPVSQPKLPPRLPARQNTTSPPVAVAEVPPPSYDAVAAKQVTDPYLNQSAVNRLGNAGISVPSLGIGRKGDSNPWENEKSQTQTASTNQLSELQSRFARMRGISQDTVATSAPSPSTASVTQPSPQPSMPSWKQSQSALQTAQNIRTDPHSVTLADAQSAAQTAGQAQRSANAFREKHADSIANAQAKAKAWDQKYKVTSKINKFLDEHTDPDEANAQQQQQQQQIPGVSSYGQASQVPVYPNTTTQPMSSPPPTELAASIARKPPPPPAPRKPAHMQAPPPVPTGTKPSLG